MRYREKQAGYEFCNGKTFYEEGGRGRGERERKRVREKERDKNIYCCSRTSFLRAELNREWI